MMVLKICGVVDERELLMLDRLGVDYAGLWFHIPKGKYELDKERFKALSHVEVQNARCVGVTMEGNAERIAEFIAGTNLSALQLHGFQLPAVVSELRERYKGTVEILKVLHLSGEKCLEEAFLERYIEAGTDAFILDCFVDRDQIGSTGQRASLNVVSRLVEQLGPSKVFVAGGLNEQAIIDLHAFSGLRGVDVDTAARKQGRIAEESVQALVRSTRRGDSEGLRWVAH